MPAILSPIAICNLALGRINVLESITSFDDGTAAAIACTQAYDFCRLDLLYKFPWGWASKYQNLTLVATQPNQEWLYAYQYPTDALFVRRLIMIPTPPPALPPPPTPAPTWNRSDTDAYPSPFEIGYLNDARVIYTDLINACAKYTFDQTDTAPFTPDFVNVFAWRLAQELAMSMSASDAVKAKADRGFDVSSMAAAAAAMNESQNSQPFIQYNAEGVRARWNS